MSCVQPLPLPTYITCVALSSDAPVRRVTCSQSDIIVGEEQSTPDVLVIGENAEPAQYLPLLANLRYRQGRRTPFAVLPTHLPELKELLSTLQVPYITYGPGGHVQAGQVNRRSFMLQTPLGEYRVALTGRLNNSLAAVAAGLALRIPLEDMLEKLGPTGAPQEAIAA
jgi:hypothetical protein